MQNYIAIPDPMAHQLTKANIYLDTAELIPIRGVRERCIAQATEAQDTIISWLRNGVCPEDRVPDVEEALRTLRQRLAGQLTDE